MRMMTTLLFAALMGMAATASGQTQPPPAPTPPDVVVLQKSWRSDTRNPALDDDPFSPNVEFSDNQRAQRINEIQNAIRGRAGQPREPPPPRPRKNDDNTETAVARDDSQSRLQVSYTYRAKIKNTGAKTIRLIDWGYVFLEPDTHQKLGDHRYTSKVRIRPGQGGELAGRSASPQTSTISVQSAGKKLAEKVVIYRVEYDDGSVWQNSPN